jgi:hypothetical protein
MSEKPKKDDEKHKMNAFLNLFMQQSQTYPQDMTKMMHH